MEEDAAAQRQELQITFESVSEANLEQLRSLNCAIFPIKYQDRIYQDILACGDVTQLAYTHGSTLVGAIGCRLENTAQGPVLYIITLGVLAPYRCMGVGSRLLERCLSIVTSELPEVTQAMLHVHTVNQEAIDFYRKFGFEVAETIRGYYKRLDPPDAVLLRKVLQHQQHQTSDKSNRGSDDDGNGVKTPRVSQRQ